MSEPNLIAYHNDPSVKDAILAQLAAHREADELVQGYGYWDDGKGCAVGCTIHSSDHMEYEDRFGIPVMLARLEDSVFEGLPVKQARQWPERFMSAISPGTDLSRVGWKLLHWLLTDETVNPGINHPTVRDAVKRCADIIADLADGKKVDPSAAESAAWSAARSAAWSAKRAAWSAESAARRAAWSAESAARSAAWSAESAARSAESAESAARSAARSAKRAARSTESAAWSAAWVKIADKLIELIAAAPLVDLEAA